MAQSNRERLLLIEKVLVLKSLSVFRDTPETILADLAPIMQEEELEQGTSIFREGDPGDCMYIIYQGQVKIHKGEKILAVLEEKEVFGELSMLDKEKRSASATAKTDCILYKIDHEPFYELIDSRPEVAKGFIKILCQRLRIQNERS